MKTETRVYTAWSPFWTRLCGKPVSQRGNCYAAIDKELLPLFKSRKACQRWIDEDSGDGKKAFGLYPHRVTVTVEYNTANADRSKQ